MTTRYSLKPHDISSISTRVENINVSMYLLLKWIWIYLAAVSTENTFWICEGSPQVNSTLGKYVIDTANKSDN